MADDGVKIRLRGWRKLPLGLLMNSMEWHSKKWKNFWQNFSYIPEKRQPNGHKRLWQ
jgi:hypothetical protein